MAVPFLDTVVEDIQMAGIPMAAAGAWIALGHVECDTVQGLQILGLEDVGECPALSERLCSACGGPRIDTAFMGCYISQCSISFRGFLSDL